MTVLQFFLPLTSTSSSVRRALELKTRGCISSIPGLVNLKVTNYLSDKTLNRDAGAIRRAG